MYVEARKRLVDWLRRQLIGPAGEGRLGMSPLDRYPTGVLHPVDPPVSGIDPASAGGGDSEPALLDEQEETAPADGETDGQQAFAQPARRRRYVPPSSVGFSCFVRGEVRLSITCSAAVYREAGAGERDIVDRDEAGRFLPGEYTRTRLPERTVQWSSATARGESRVAIWEGQARAGVDVRARPHRDGRIVTVTLCNRDELDPDVPPRLRMRDRVAKSLFEAGLSCVVESGELVEYPRVDPSLLTKEEQELELQYREQRIYAVGHGAAANWDVGVGREARVWSDFMPEAEVPMMTVNTGGGDAVLRLSYLAGAPTADGPGQSVGADASPADEPGQFADADASPADEPGQFADADASPADEPEQFADADAPMADALERFVDGYAGWIAGQERAASELGSCDERSAAGRICGRMSRALDRMRGCVEMLRTDRKAAESFRLANRAMLDQMVQADRAGGKATDPGGYRWRPFQLAFLLTVMVSAIREEDGFRDVLDLIWFPTGGGKTEAYLGLIAFLIVWRRLKYPGSGGGTAAFMRYTLRLLTRQQFERAARMVCALELIRRRRPERLGEAPIDVGIWVGGAISPNRYDQAREVVEEIRDGKPGARYKLLMERCPWCGSPFDATHGYRATEVEFHFHCTDPGCAFGTDPRPLPCNVVDDALYERPPSLLIGTIDKFARVAWEERTGAFFGAGSGSRPPSRPPELVIQDELHLVTGPLGSVAGLYEAGLDTLLVRRGVRPKYVASTATIRMAREQVQRLYARDLAVFPPPGLSHDDTWFARTDRERPGRLYVGYLAPLLDQQHCFAPLAAALLAAPEAVFDEDADREELLDAWWTQVVYHGSLRGVGNSNIAFGTGVRDFGRRIAGERDEGRGATSEPEPAPQPTPEPGSGPDPEGETERPGSKVGAAGRFQDAQIAQLTSRRTPEDNAKTFLQLAQPRGDEGCLDAVLATNMVSVGLDVARLALMIVNGQPLTTAEYIQATSRVGRADVPGLVVANYHRHQARSLSHYESFRPYHESFYRFVEPGSVTPHTWQVRSRALHAALVIALRHVCKDLRSNTSAGHFDQDAPEVQAVIAELKRRCERAAAEPGQGQGATSRLGRDTASHLDRLAGQWHDEARRCGQERRQLAYQAQAGEKNADRLLYTHGESRPGLWATLHSMRNVEGAGSLKVHDWPPRA